MSIPFARLLGLALAPWILGAAPAELHRGVGYPGAAAFVSVGTITVVYPAGAGEPVEVNRRSAEARARWLASVHKNKVTVVADDQLTEEQKRGNLLILGWNNRVFGPSGLAAPFTHDQDGLTFLGLGEPEAGADLLVFHRNPLNWSSHILFWSRIDPERDRFFVLPRVGSDWAIYRDYGILRQGMFVPARAWPPARDPAAEANHDQEALARRKTTATFDSEHVHLAFDRERFLDADIRAIAKARETAFGKAVAALGPAPAGFRIAFYVYDNQDEKKQATGVDDPTHAVPRQRQIHATRRYALSTAFREEVHVLARALYGPCYLTSLCEGVALSAENSLRGEDLEIHAARLRSAGRFPALADVLDEERFRSIPDDARAVAAGVVMAWLRQTYGPVGLKKVYGLEEGRVGALAAALSTTEGELSASSTAWADARLAARKNDLDFLAAEDEAQERRVSSDWAGMAEALRKALRAKPGDPQTIFNLASAQMRANDLAGAEASLKEILGAKLPPDASRFVIFGHYQLGRVYDLAGRRAEALAEYDAVLSLPDEFGAHALARERKATPATREQLE